MRCKGYIITNELTKWISGMDNWMNKCIYLGFINEYIQDENMSKSIYLEWINQYLG